MLLYLVCLHQEQRQIKPSINRGYIYFMQQNQHKTVPSVMTPAAWKQNLPICKLEKLSSNLVNLAIILHRLEDWRMFKSSYTSVLNFRNIKFSGSYLQFWHLGDTIVISNYFPKEITFYYTYIFPLWHSSPF